MSNDCVQDFTNQQLKLYYLEKVPEEADNEQRDYVLLLYKKLLLNYIFGPLSCLVTKASFTKSVITNVENNH